MLGNIKKLSAYAVFFIAVYGICWFGILALFTPYGTPGRAWYILGLCATFIIAIISYHIGHSTPWKKLEDELDGEE